MNYIGYGICRECGGELYPVYFEEDEYQVNPVTHGLYKTGRHRKAVDYLICENCMNKECVDDTFDGPWYY